MIKGVEMDHDPGLLGGSHETPRVLPSRREAAEEDGEVAKSGMQVLLEAGKGEERGSSPRILQKEPACQRLDFSPRRPILNIWLPEL